MASIDLTERDLKRELSEYRDRFPKLADDELFVLWFLRAFVTEDERLAAEALSGGSWDKNVDAVFIDEPARIVFILQGKYRKEVSTKNEHHNDVTGFAQIAVGLSGDEASFRSLCKGISPEVQRKLQDARDRILKRRYGVQMLYVTLGKCSSGLRDEADRIVRRATGEASFQLFDGRQIMKLLADYLDGVAPPVPTLDLEIESGSGIRTSGVFNRYDSKTDIESWVFAMNDVAIAGLYQRAGRRLFARNVRGFLERTQINRGMEETLNKEPEYFWYYNNGITVICDDAKQESSRGRNILRVTNPQIINGQQTTRTLAAEVRKGARASVLVRVIRVPREDAGTADRFEALVSRIVAATNWQNAIRASDLMANDRRQIEIERNLRKLDYQYLRKRMTKSEARRMAGAKYLRIVKKEEMAQAVAACDLDPSLLREGKERLFEERWYDTVFSTADPSYYLSRYWLMRQVSYAARGYPERAYAKWLVLNFLWLSLEPACRARARSEVFRKGCEREEGRLLNPMYTAINSVFNAALQFYRRKRGKGKKALDVSTFFQRRRLHKDFVSFWKGSANRSRTPFVSAWSRFEKTLHAEAQA